MVASRLWSVPRAPHAPTLTLAGRCSYALSMIARLPVAICACLISAACGNAGALGSDCYPNNSCDNGLQCIVSIHKCATLDDAGVLDAAPDAPANVCGNGIKEGTEQCDGTDLGGAACTRVAPGWQGTLNCATTCLLDTSGCAPPTTGWSDLTDKTKWTTFDVSTVNAGAAGFSGGTFDGRYVYLVPWQNSSSTPDGLVPRYDTTATFTAAPSWATFDTTAVNPMSRGYWGGAFDGRYTYLVPFEAPGAGVVTRFDTTGSFPNSGAWSVFDLAPLNVSARGFMGAVFDGRFLYLVPENNGTNPDGLVTRYDTTGVFSSTTSWSMFDVASVNASAKGFFGGTFDGRYVYFSPNEGTFPAANGTVARFDTTGSFESPAAWTTFDASSVYAGAKGFEGAVFDGKYVYFVPGANSLTTLDGLVLRMDTSQSFESPSSWSVFDVATVNALAKGFSGGTFDGRFLYLAPAAKDAPVARFDTTAKFDTASSWSFLDTRTVNPNADGFCGAVFDGRAVYFVPQISTIGYGTVVVRFDAKSVSWMPKGWNASFL